MSIDLTDEQRQAIAREAKVPLRLIDRVTNIQYVLLPADLYEKIESFLNEDDVRGMEPYLAALSPEDWEDEVHYQS
jgi:hypothetical protein